MDSTLRLAITGWLAGGVIGIDDWMQSERAANDILDSGAALTRATELACPRIKSNEIGESFKLSIDDSARKRI